MPEPAPLRRIAIRGLSGSGKTTLARSLSQKLGIPNTELDELYWRPGWTHASDEEFLADVQKLADRSEWIICGNYTRCRSLIDPKADTYIWLDYPFVLVLSRLVRRCFIRSRRKEMLWDHCQESLWNSFFGKDAIVWWIFRVRKRQKKQLETLFSAPQPGVAYFRFLHPRETEAWLKSLACP